MSYTFDYEGQRYTLPAAIEKVRAEQRSRQDVIDAHRAVQALIIALTALAAAIFPVDSLVLTHVGTVLMVSSALGLIYYFVMRQFVTPDIRSFVLEKERRVEIFADVVQAEISSHLFFEYDVDLGMLDEKSRKDITHGVQRDYAFGPDFVRGDTVLSSGGLMTLYAVGDDLEVMVRSRNAKVGHPLVTT